MQPLDLVILTLATYYAAVTLAKLDGPFGLVERARHAVYRARGFEAIEVEDSEMEWGRVTPSEDLDVKPHIGHLGDDWLAAGVSCPLCMSLYCGAALALAWYAGGEVGQAAVGVLAVAGGASALFSMGRYW